MGSTKKHDILSLASALIVMIIAAGVDRWIRFQEINAKSAFNVSPFIWARTIGNFFLMAFCILLFWFVTYKIKPSKFLFIIFLAIGMILSFYDIATFYIPALNRIRLLYPFTLLSIISAFIAITGLLNLLLPIKQHPFQKKTLQLMVILLTVGLIVTSSIRAFDQDDSKREANTITVPLLLPPSVEEFYTEELGKTTRIITIDDGRPIAQISNPQGTRMSELEAKNGLKIRAYLPDLTAPQQDKVSFQLLSSIRYEFDDVALIVTTTRPSQVLNNYTLLLGEESHLLKNDRNVWITKDMPVPNTPHQTAFLEDDLIITVTGNFSPEDLLTFSEAITIEKE